MSEGISIEDILSNTYSIDEINTLLRCADFYLRDEQRRPEGCSPIWQIKAGRGWGKTRTGAEHTLNILEDWGPLCEGIMGSKTLGDTLRDLVHGKSGLMACAKARGYTVDLVTRDKQSSIVHPAGGRLVITSGEIPDGARGLNLNYGWLDELEHWQQADLAFMNIEMACRTPGPPPGNHMVVTSTPNYKSTLQFRDRDDVTVVRGSMADNANNLDAGAVARRIKAWEGNPLGAQELDGHDIVVSGVVATLESIHSARISIGTYPQPDSIVVGVDPGSFGQNTVLNDPTGVVVVSRTGADFYVLYAQDFAVADERTWMRAAVEAYASHNAGRLVIETNQGGMPLVNTLRRVASEMGVHMVIEPHHTQLSKLDRALGTMQQYQLGRVHHNGVLKKLERELSSWGPRSGKKSPNLLDAEVYAMNALLEGSVNRSFENEISGPTESGLYIPAEIRGIT